MCEVKFKMCVISRVQWKACEYFSRSQSNTLNCRLLSSILFCKLYFSDNFFFYTTYFIAVPPSIVSLTCDDENRTLTCVYTGSPTISVCWEKDSVPLDIHNSCYQVTETVIDRASSIPSYSTVLTVSEMPPTGLFGNYTCRVSNQIGAIDKSVEMISEY